MAKIIQETEDMYYEDRLKEHMFSLGKKRQRGNVLLVFKFIKEYHWEHGQELFSIPRNNR